MITITDQCIGCTKCVKVCPFGALFMEGKLAKVNEACTLCGACVPACPTAAIVMPQQQSNVDLSSYKGVWVFVELLDKASGKGKAHTYTVVHRTFHPAFEKELPYIIVIVELDEGPRYLSRMKEAVPEDMKLDMPVEVIFEELNEEITMPYFRPTK